MDTLTGPMVWAMAALALWHFTIFLPDRFVGGIGGALATALGGALVAGYLLPNPGLPGNPPGLAAAGLAAAGAGVALAVSAVWERRSTVEAPPW